MASGRDRAAEAGSLRLYRRLLTLYPAEFRAEYGRELCLAFADRCRAERSWTGLLRFWLEALGGILNEAPKEHYYMLAQDLRYAIRVLRADRVVTATAIAILGLGIGSTTLVFSLANGLLLRPLPFAQPERLVAVDEYDPADAREFGQVNFFNYLDLRARARLLDDLAVYRSDQLPIRGEGGAAEVVPAAQMSDGVFRVLGVAPLLGRPFSRAEDRFGGPQVVVLGEELWQRRYGRDPHILGKRIEIGNATRSVVGVMPARFRFPERAELWVPLEINPAEARRTDYFLHAVARLKPGIAVAQAGAELRALLAQIHRENPAAYNGRVARAVPLRDFLAGSYRRAVTTLMLAVGLVLLIACANVSHLLLVRASARGREMAVRAALGATRRRLIRQLVAESVVLGLGGGALGLLLAYPGIPALLSLIPIPLPLWLDFSIDHRVLGFALAVSLLTSIGFGIAPALGASAADLSGALKEGGGRWGTSSLRQKLLRHGLVVGELALSVALLAGAGLMIRSFVALRGQHLGFAPENVLSLHISYPDARYPDGPRERALVQRLREEISALPGVAAMAFSSGVPLNDDWGRIVTIEGRPLPLEKMPTVNHVVVTPGYFKTLRIALRKGRDFTDDDFAAPRIVVVSESFARRHWPRESPLGKRIRFGPPFANEPWHTVVGVVADSRHAAIKGEDRSNVYLPYSPQWSPDCLLVRTTADPLRLAPAIGARIAGFDRDIAVARVAGLEEIVARASWRDRFFTFLLAVFAALAVLLAAVGLYGLLSYTVSLQTREIGIRLALGASAARLRAMVLRQGLALAAAGVLIGLGAALALTRLLAAQLYEVSPLDPWTYGAAPALLIGVALLAAYVPIRRATRVDPVVVLRQE